MQIFSSRMDPKEPEPGAAQRQINSPSMGAQRGRVLQRNSFAISLKKIGRVVRIFMTGFPDSVKDFGLWTQSNVPALLRQTDR